MIQPGLERIGRLLKDVKFPWKALHVAGTNGKGSICGYASALLTRRTIRNGRFTSPHLIDRWDCITINDTPVSEQDFRKVEKHFILLNEREGINASEFELLTATAFQLFNEKKVEVGVVEVGMGGKLDATNILNNQVVSVVSKIARDHQNFLGDTLEEIARHKAGILRPNVPFIVNPINEWNVHDVIDAYAKGIGAGPRINPDTEDLWRDFFSSQDWHKFATPLLPFQRDNAVLAYLAFIEVLKSMDQSTLKAARLLPGIKNKKFPGRLQQHSVTPVFGRSRRQILVDGSHNPDAARALNEFVFQNLRTKRQTRNGKDPPERGGWPVTWVLAMTDGKDARQYLAQLLRPGDNVITTTFGPVDGMPWVKPMDPKELRKIAMEVRPEITSRYIPTPGTFRALCAAKYLGGDDSPVVLTGSLYLVSDFLREKQQYTADPESMDIEQIDKGERNSVRSFLSGMVEHADQNISASTSETKSKGSEEDERRKLQEEIKKLDRELQFLEVEENRLKRSRSLQFDSPISNGKSKLPKTLTLDLENREGNVSAKQKLFEDFESIRKQLEQLPGGASSAPATPTPGLPDLRHMVKNVEKKPDSEDVIKTKREFRIRAHFARGPSEFLDGGEKAKIRSYRLLSASDWENEIKVRRVVVEDKKKALEGKREGKQKVVRKTRPLKIRLHDVESDPDEKSPHDRGYESNEERKPAKVFILKHRSNARPKWESE